MHLPSQSTAELSLASDWQKSLQQAITDPAELLEILGLSQRWLPAAQQAASQFGLKVPRSYVDRMARGDINDPLLRQVLPIAAELENAQGFLSDPVGDALAKADNGIIQKYQQRALLISTGACGVHCRYCFRRHFPYNDELAAKGRWQQSLQWLAQHRDIQEVILSGGDPLSLTDQKLLPLMQGLAELPHVHTLRLHTRQPIVLPNRVTANLIDTLKRSGKQLVVVLHANHANELDESVANAMEKLHLAGIQLLNQSVLLAHVNNQADALVNLSRRLFAIHVLPYYLHCLDRVQGSAHFEVPESEALALQAAISAQLPGYLVPKLVREEAGKPAKTLVG